MWNVEDLSSAPHTYAAPELSSPGVEALFYAGPAYRGKPTRCFAWYGEPPAHSGSRLPAMVLVHGGGGTAYAEWVRLWTSRGYIAIAMDTCGSLPDARWCAVDRLRHAHAGPPGWGGFAQVDEPPEDQWCYHAVASVILAISHLHTRSRVDVQRIGITGVSWGGFLTCVAASLDHRLACAMPVYGCGFVTVDGAWNQDFAALGRQRTDLWQRRFDPASYLTQATLPMLWLNGSNDFAYFPAGWQASYRLPSGPRTVCLKLRMEHGHGGAGEDASELAAFADHHLRNGISLARVGKADSDGQSAWAIYDGAFSLRRAELVFTRSSGHWPERQWDTLPAMYDLGARRITAVVPSDATAWYLHTTDFRGLQVSSEHWTR